MNKNISSLTDQNLIAELKNLVQQEREVLAETIRYLQEVDTRRLYLELGYSSLFSFCTQGLGYSEGSAYRRIKAARVRCGPHNRYVFERNWVGMTGVIERN
jgi:hypothetical protein